MQRLVQIVDVQVVVHMLVAEATGGTACALVTPVVVVVGDVQVAKVDVAEGVVVSDEGRFPVVVEVVPRDGDPVRGADDVDLAVLGACQHTLQPSGRGH